MSVKVIAHHNKDVTIIQVFVTHPSEDGQRVDSKTGKFVPASFMQSLTVKADDRTLVKANLGGDLSHNPEFTFKARNLKAGSKVSVDWLDSAGDKGTETTTVA